LKWTPLISGVRDVAVSRSRVYSDMALIARAILHEVPHAERCSPSSAETLPLMAGLAVAQE
jgi:hypothetical protein